MVSPENMHISINIQTKKGVFVYLAICRYIDMYITTMKIKVKNLKQSREGYMEGFISEERKRENHIIIISKIKRKF